MDDHVLTKGDTSSLFKSTQSCHHSVFWVYSVRAVKTWQQVQKSLPCEVYFMLSPFISHRQFIRNERGSQQEHSV